MTDEGDIRQKTPQLYLDEESKTEEALKTFQPIEKCWYQNKSLGSSGQTEYMTCDCTEQWDSVKGQNSACGEDSECINRATSVECVDDDCGCGDGCQNQRFQRQIYEPVTVFQTELKGYGLRADKVIGESSFIYEYIGEVINEDTFRKRMVTYDEKKFKHFYFMMLKKDAFIDATVKGSLARFANHSCNPNAYVDKWVVGDKLRMGIFAKRTIQKGEEITFDYNVDRYGAQSQPCYCGEPNCIKFMGGKTQTDAALLLPEGISEALGVSVQQEKQWLKENKHLRTKQQKSKATINEQFVKDIEVSPLDEFDVTKVMSSLMKSQDLPITKKLVERIYLTNDDNINLSIVKVHGYKTLSTVLQSEDIDDELIIKILKILNKWPKLTRNKISSSKIEDKIKDISKSDNEEIQTLCNQLLEEWSKLQMAYRIPKLATKSNTSYSRAIRSHSPEEDTGYGGYEPIEEDPTANLPEGWQAEYSTEHEAYYYYNEQENITTWEKPAPPPPIPVKIETPRKPREPRDSTPSFNEAKLAQLEAERLQQAKLMQFNEVQNKQKMLLDLINQNHKQAEQRRALDKLKQQSEAKEKAKEKAKKHKPSKSKPQNVEKLWGSVFAKYIPNFVKKHESEIGRDNVKGCARDIVKLLTDKELAKDNKKVPPLELENAKLKKIKDFTKSYMEKFLIKYRSKHRRDENSNEPKKPKI